MNVETSSASVDWPHDAFEEVKACLWCFSSDLAPVVLGVRDWFFDAVQGEFDFARCERCGSLVLLRRPAPDYLPAAYTNYYTHADARDADARTSGLVGRIKAFVSSSYIRSRYTCSGNLGDAALGRFYRLFPDRRREIDVHLRFLPRVAGTVLDYGCGNGSFLERAKSKGHSVLGIDFDSGAIEAAAKKGIAVALPDEADRVLASAPFDHISAAHVIEHVVEPKRLLADFRRWMKSGGTLFLELPNANAGGLFQYGAFWRGLEAPRHFSLPTRSILREALEEVGFKSVEYHRRGTVKHWLWAESEAARRKHGSPRTEYAMSGSGDGEDEFLTVTANAV